MFSRRAFWHDALKDRSTWRQLSWSYLETEAPDAGTNDGDATNDASTGEDSGELAGDGGGVDSGEFTPTSLSGLTLWPGDADTDRHAKSAKHDFRKTKCRLSFCTPIHSEAGLAFGPWSAPSPSPPKPTPTSSSIGWSSASTTSLAPFYDIGVSLAELHEKKLYASLGYGSFEAMLVDDPVEYIDEGFPVFGGKRRPIDDVGVKDITAATRTAVLKQKGRLGASEAARRAAEIAARKMAAKLRERTDDQAAVRHVFKRGSWWLVIEVPVEMAAVVR